MDPLRTGVSLVFERAIVPQSTAASTPGSWYDLRVDADEKRAARRARAEARRTSMTVEVASLGQPKPPPYATYSPIERLAAATRLIAYHQAIRGAGVSLARADWPGETFLISD
jgi:hypothetical protein